MPDPIVMGYVPWKVAVSETVVVDNKTFEWDCQEYVLDILDQVEAEGGGLRYVDDIVEFSFGSDIWRSSVLEPFD